MSISASGLLTSFTATVFNSTSAKVDRAINSRNPAKISAALVMISNKKDTAREAVAPFLKGARLGGAYFAATQMNGKAQKAAVKHLDKYLAIEEKLQKYEALEQKLKFRSP